MKSQKAKYVLTEWTRDDEKLMTAVERNQLDKVHNLVVKKRVDPTKIEPNKGLSSLHLAVDKGNASIVDIFLAQGLGSRIDTKDLGGYTATHHAAKSGQFPILQKLLQQKPNLCVFDRQMKSALHHACEGGNIGCVQLLLAENISVHFKDRDGKTSLCHAAEKGQASICRLLIENGSDVNEADLEGRTPLLWAAIKNHPTVCSYLLQKGANLDATDSRGHTATWYARRNNDIELLKILHQAETAFDNEKGAMRKSLDKESLDHPYEPIGTELGRIEDDPLQEGTATRGPSAAEHPKEVAPVAPPPRPQRLPPFTGKSSSLLELGNEEGSTIGEKLGFMSDMLSAKVEEDVVDAGKKKKASARYSLSTEMTSNALKAFNENDKKEENGNLDIGGLNFGSFREMLDDAFRKNNLLEDKDWNEAAVMEDVKSVNLSHAEEQSEEVGNYDVKSNHGSEGKHDIDLPSVTASLVKDSGTGKKGSYTPMTHVSEASTSITAIAELNEKEILLPRFDLSEDPQITKEAEFEYISRELALNHSSEKRANILSVQENGESNTVYAGILGNNSEDKLLGEHIKLLEELKMALEKRNEMELEKIELLERIKLTSRSQEWVMKELAEMKNTIEDIIDSLDERKSSAEDVKKFRMDLEKINSQLDSLLRLELEEVDDVLIYSQSPNPDNIEITSKVARLEKEKQDLVLKLKEILSENIQLHGQVADIEQLMSKAKEMKEENEGLISDCKEFVEISGKDSEEVEDLMRLFKETIEENDALKLENEDLLSRLNNVAIISGTGDLDELKKENVRLMFERMQLEEAVEKQSKALLEMSEKLKASDETSKNSNVEMFHEEEIQISSEAISGERESEDADYRLMYEELKKESIEVLNELRAKEDLVTEYNKVVEENEEFKKQNAILKNTLDKKSNEVKQLNDQVKELGEQLEEAFTEFKRAINVMQSENAEEYNKLKAENKELRLIIQELNETLEEKDTFISKNMEKQLSSDMKSCEHLDEGSQTDLEVNGDSRNSTIEKRTRSPIYEDLKNAMMESKSLLQENNKLKKALVELENGKPKTVIDQDSELKQENEKLKEANDKLQFEVTSLKRTISEQGAYLAYLTPSTNDIERVIFPSEAGNEKFMVKPNEVSDVLVKDASENRETRNQRVELEKLTSEVIILRSQVECLEKMKEELVKSNEKEGNALNAKLQSLEKLFSDLSKKSAEKDDKVLELNVTLKDQQNELMAARRLENECDRLIKDYRDIAGGLTLDDISNSDRKVILAEMRQWLRNLQSQSAEQNSLKLENEKLLEETEKLKADLKKLYVANEDLSRQKDLHEKDNESKFEAIQERLANESKEVVKLKSALAELNEEEMALREQLEKLKYQLTAKDEEIRSGENKTASMLKEMENREIENILRTQSNFSKEYEDQLLNQIESLTAQTLNLQEQVKNKSDEIENLRSDMLKQTGDLKANLEVYQNRMADEQAMDEECRKLKEKYYNLLAEKESLENDHNLAFAELKSKLDLSMQDSRDLSKTKDAYIDLSDKYARVEQDLDKLQLNLNNVTAQHNKAVEKIVCLEKYCRELEELNCHLKEKSASSSDSDNKIVSELREANFGLLNKMNSLEQEKQKLIIENEQTQLLLEMEKLKNIPVPGEHESLHKSPQNDFGVFSKTNRASISVSRTQSFISVSPVSKPQHLADFDDFGSSIRDGFGSPENQDINTRLLEENQILRNTLDKIEYGFCQPMRLKSEATQTQGDSNKSRMTNDELEYSVTLPLALVAENRRLFLDLGNLHSSLRRRSSFIVHSNGLPSRHSSKPLEQLRQDFERTERGFLDEVASKSLEHLSVLISLEEEVDRLWKNKAMRHNGLVNGSSSLQESSLMARLKMHNASLRQLKDLLQSVVDNEKLYDVALSELSSHCPLLPGVNATLHSSTVPVSSPIQLMPNSEESSKLLMQLQTQLLENERKYKEIIQKYRRHLICAVQGQMDPEVKESLLNFIESKKNESRKGN